MTTNATKTTQTSFTISNICGGQMRTFRADKDGRPSGAAIRYAAKLDRNAVGGYKVSDPDIHHAIYVQIAINNEDYHLLD